MDIPDDVPPPRRSGKPRSPIRQEMEAAAQDQKWRNMDVPLEDLDSIRNALYVMAHRMGCSLRTSTQRLPGGKVRLFIHIMPKHKEEPPQ